MPVDTLKWTGTHLRIIDQTLLPGELVYLDCKDVETVAEAIEVLRVRGAPAIGVSAAWGVVIGAMTADDPKVGAQKAIGRLKTTRPTAVNLFWALERMARVVDSGKDDLLGNLTREAQAIEDEDRKTCRQMGKHGAELLKDGWTVLTHCNAGGLATSDYGTALGVIYAAVEKGLAISVYADETRPLLQGARLTAWELQASGVPVTVICDSVAPTLMRKGEIDAVIVGADRIAANGDVANKIGTYSVAVAAKAHNIPMYVVAPMSTIDFSLSSGDSIPIEERGAHEIAEGFGKRTVPEGVAVRNPAFDVTPAELITAIITEHGVARPSFTEALAMWAD